MKRQENWFLCLAILLSGSVPGFSADKVYLKNNTLHFCMVPEPPDSEVEMFLYNPEKDTDV